MRKHYWHISKIFHPAVIVTVVILLTIAAVFLKNMLNRTPQIPIAPGGYYTKGNTIYDSRGNPHIFSGVSRPSLEWNSIGDHLGKEDYATIRSWGANIVRLPLNQRYWLTDKDGYKATIAQNVKWIEENGMDVILDLHWSDRGDESDESAQQRMADNDSLTFWIQVAAQYKNDGRVLFELYNEPHDIDWQVWQYGGRVDGFDAVGMQDLYDAIRAEGADNLILVGGNDWSYDLSGVSSHTIDGYNIVYAMHMYDHEGKDKPEAWNNALGSVAAAYPVVVTEFGSLNCNATFYDEVFDFIRKRTLSYVAWAWYPGGCEFPSLISSWEGAPTVSGEKVRQSLLNLSR